MVTIPMKPALESLERGLQLGNFVTDARNRYSVLVSDVFALRDPTTNRCLLCAKFGFMRTVAKVDGVFSWKSFHCSIPQKRSRSLVGGPDVLLCRDRSDRWLAFEGFNVAFEFGASNEGATAVLLTISPALMRL